MTVVGQKIVKSLNVKMKLKDCPIQFIEVDSERSNEIMVKGWFLKYDKELSALMPFPLEYDQRLVSDVVEGFYLDWKRKSI